MKYIERKTKRIFDITVALFCIVVFSPLFLICYLAIKFDDGGPALFSQERIGYKGKAFNIHKFRTMRCDAEESGPQLYSDNDSRLTRAGAFLRKHHLDELPQLWNVLVGDMSFIGPRPERKYFIDKSWSTTPAIPSSTSCVQESPPMPLSTMATPTLWRRCFAALSSTSTIWSTTRYGLTPRFSSRHSPTYYSARNSNIT